MKKIFIIIGTVVLIGIVIPLIISFTQTNENISSEIKSEASLSIPKSLKLITIYQSFSEEDGKIIVGTHTIFNIKIQEIIFINGIDGSSTISYLPFDDNKNEQNNLDEYSGQLVFASVYENNQFGISFDLPDNWSFEESPSFIDGVMTYNGNNIVFKDNSEEKLGFMLSVSNNENNFSIAGKYVNYLLEENKRLYEIEETPFIWKYDDKYETKLGENIGYVLENIKGPGGYRDAIYILSENNIFEFSYSFVDEDGISQVNDTLRDVNNKVLNTLKIDNNENINTSSTIPEDWKTISSNIYGYEISFPEGWYWAQGNEKHDSSTDVSMTDISISPDECYFNGDCISSSEILVRLAVSNMVCNTSQECANYLDYSPGCRIYSDRQSITIDNFEATKQFEYPDEDCATEQSYTSSIFWKKDTDAYYLTGSNINQEDFSKYADVFEQISQSIKFK